MMICLVVVWALVMISMIMFDGWIKSVAPVISGWPIIPVVILALTSLTVIWIATYTYSLYRKVVEDESDPA